MRRVVVIAVLAAVVVAAALFVRGGGTGGSDKPEYKVVFDNSFGLTEGTEVRAAGVTVGKVTKLDVERQTARAVLTIQLNRTDFGDFRRDVRCSIEPQSLIGEYFMNCDPGKGQKLADGARIAVDQTSGTVPPDLVANILRRPRRERLGLILSELGAGLAARGPELSATIHRAVPALHETDRVLGILADEHRTITSLTREADTVVGALAGNKRDVARFVAEARDTSVASASRREDIRGSLQRFPEFLRQFRPTLRKLGFAAEQQEPALRDLRASADDVTTLFNRLGPFASASRPAVKALGQTAKTGRTAVHDARPTVQKLRTLGAAGVEPLTNLRYTLEALDDRDYAVERNPVTPGGKGYTGLEALLTYPFLQAQAANIFDTRGYLLKLNALVNECTQYTNAKTARDNPGRTQRCSSALGPNQIGINQPDPTASSNSRSTRSQRHTTKRRRDGSERPKTETAPQQQAPAGEAPAQSAPDAAPQLPSVPNAGGIVDKLLETLPMPGTPGGQPDTRPAAPAVPQTPKSDETDKNLLDFLLGP